jgi:hypothetical protein
MAFAMLARNKPAPGWSGLVINWKEKNMAAEKQWNGPQFM